MPSTVPRSCLLDLIPGLLSFKLHAVILDGCCLSHLSLKGAVHRYSTCITWSLLKGQCVYYTVFYLVLLRAVLAPGWDLDFILCNVYSINSLVKSHHHCFIKLSSALTMQPSLQNVHSSLIFNATEKVF
jgi:hypothetical protein